MHQFLKAEVAPHPQNEASWKRKRKNFGGEAEKQCSKGVESTRGEILALEQWESCY